MAQIVVVPGSRASSLANPGEQELLSHKSSIRSSLNDAPVLGPTPTLGRVMCYHGWPGLGSCAHLWSQGQRSGQSKALRPKCGRGNTPKENRSIVTRGGGSGFWAVYTTDIHYSLGREGYCESESRLLIFNPAFLPPHASDYWAYLWVIFQGHSRVVKQPN